VSALLNNTHVSLIFSFVRGKPEDFEDMLNYWSLQPATANRVKFAWGIDLVNV